MPSKYGFESEADKQAELERWLEKSRAYASERALRLKPIWDRVAPIICDILEDFAKARGWLKIKTECNPLTLEISVCGTLKTPFMMRGITPIEAMKIAVNLSSEGNSLSIWLPDSWYLVYSGKDYLDTLLQVISNHTGLPVTLKEIYKGSRESPSWPRVIREFAPDR